MKMRLPSFARHLPGLCLLAFCGMAFAHPEPDIPVKSHFMKDGTCLISLEIDPRCFVAEPITEPYTMKQELDKMSDAQKQELIEKATDLVKRSVEFLFEPAGKAEPVFSFAFAGIAEAELKGPEDPVMIQGKWKGSVPGGATGWRLRAAKESRFAVVFRNYLEGIEQPRFSVLFPGETSFLLELSAAK